MRLANTLVIHRWMEEAFGIGATVTGWSHREIGDVVGLSPEQVNNALQRLFSRGALEHVGFQEYLIREMVPSTMDEATTHSIQMLDYIKAHVDGRGVVEGHTQETIGAALGLTAGQISSAVRTLTAAGHINSVRIGRGRVIWLGSGPCPIASPEPPPKPEPPKPPSILAELAIVKTERLVPYISATTSAVTYRTVSLAAMPWDTARTVEGRV